MKKSQEYELRKYANDLQSLCGVKDYLFNDGPNRGVRALDIWNGKNTEVTFLADRGLDVAKLKYRGMNVGLCNKMGIRSPYLYQEDGASGFLKQFFGGIMSTCGMTYCGAAGEDDGKALGLHGPINNIPAEHVCAEMVYEGDDAVMRVSGEVHEAEVFGTDMCMKREFRLETERDILHIHDVVTNNSYAAQPLMMIYHINFGYPMLDAGAKCYFSATKVEGVTDFAKEGIDKYDEMEAPGVGRDEQCYYHTCQPAEGEAFAMLHNERKGVAAIVRFDKAVFPIMCEWKCMRAGEYALGLEPTTSGTLNRSTARERGWLTELASGESREFNVSIELTEDAAMIEHYKKIAHKKA